MRKLLPLIICLLCWCVVPANAQVTRLQARNDEWKGYSLPQTAFARQITPDKDLIFRIPADWKQEGKELIFDGPHSAQIRLSIAKVPDGYPLQDYFGSILRAVLDNSAAPEAPLTRKTQLQDLEAREILVEAPNTEGEMIRSTSWITVSGPLAVTFNFQAPAAHAAELEPFFKAAVQSIIFLSPDYPAFETRRSENIKSPAPGPMHEIESIVASLNEAYTDREAAVARLTALFSSQPDVTVDLLLDRRSFVRIAAVQALARANNKALTPFLWEMLDDPEPLVAEAAARNVAGTSDVVAKTLEHSISGMRTETIARIWPFLAKDKRNELLQIIFSQTAVSPPTAPKNQGKTSVSVSVGELTPVKPGHFVVAAAPVNMSLSQVPTVQMGALTLLSSMTAEEFKLPLARIMASNYEPLIAVGLQVANDRMESLPVDSLFKLVKSSDQSVSKLTAQSLGLSASVSDIPRIEALISKDAANSKTLDDELKLAIKKIQFRNQLGTAKSPAETRQIINKTLSDSALSDFAWRYDCEATVSGCAPSASLKRDFTVKPFAENLFPKRVAYYTAIPNPGQVVQKFYETLHGLQMDSPRAQSNLVLTMGAIRQMLATTLSAPPDAASLIDYAGIDPDSPIALGAWTADNALDKTAGARRRAIVLRVKDRQRFERVVEKFQQIGSSFVNLTDFMAVGTRLIAALPAALPFSAQAMLSMDPAKTAAKPAAIRASLKYSFIGEEEWNGFRIKTIEDRRIDSTGQIESTTTHMVFIGDIVVLAPDLATIRDLLENSSDRQYLADNAEFRKTIESRGDIVYFSDPTAAMAQSSDVSKQPDYKFNESGVLNITSSSWENTHHVTFDESDWSKPFLPFDPKELSAPRDLLPASTIAYYLMKVDLPAVWSQYAKTFFVASNEIISNLWSIDFNQQVLPELGPECGVVMLELPNKAELNAGTWAIFCKMKSNKLADALSAGKLLRGVGPTTNVAQVKSGEDSFFVGTRNGFLVVSNREKGVTALDGKSSLAATRDYSRTVAKVPGGIVAFAGYNLEAAVAGVSNAGADGTRAQIANVIFSIASAFHSQNFFATATPGAIEAHSSVSMDREGRYAVADVSFLPRGTNITYATLEPHGVPITDQNRLSDLVLRIRARTAGPIDNIKDDIKSAHQVVEQKSANELTLTIAARRADAEKPVELPIKDPEFAPYLKATPEFAADDKDVMDKAREIAGTDRDAWSVARKLANWIHTNLEWKLVVNATVSQTLATREADCSEFSQLFVAMARSLGLPARTVSGLAYSGNSFGGHAWVEVWAGKWIELDPTWGTNFVDATHVRGTSTALLTSAALNLIDIEVLETRRTVADFQKSPRALAEHLAKAIPLRDKSGVEAAIDLATLTDEFMGSGSWAKMNDAEREQMSSAYRRVLNEILQTYTNDSGLKQMRLVHLEEKGDVAEAIYVKAPFNMLLKLRLSRRNNVWYLVELVQADLGLNVVFELLQPTVAAIQKMRAGEKSPSAGMSDFLRVLFLLQSNSGKAIEAADAALKLKPADKNLRFLKALALMNLEKGDEATKLMRELSNEAFVPAIYKLAGYLNDSKEEKDQKEAIDFYERYSLLEPHDPRALSDLGLAYDAAHNGERAEAAFRKAVACDQGNKYYHLNLIEFLVRNDRIGEVRPLLVAAEQQFGANEDVFGSAMYDLYLDEEYKQAEKFAATEPSRMKTSAQANLALGKAYSADKRYPEALRVLNNAVQLDRKSGEAYLSLAGVYRRMSNWNAALKSAQQALNLDDQDAEGYYELACALARLGRIKEAMSALEKAVELDPIEAEGIVDEKDLKPLSSLPAFKKLIPPPEKP